MSRDVNGNYSLPAGNPVVAGTLVEDSWANTTMNDLASAMQDSLSRSGNGAMLASLRSFAGVIGAPGYSWSLEPTSGLYRAGAGDIRYSISAVDKYKILADSMTFYLALNGKTGTDIASAATVNLTTATGNFVHITGTTTITAVTLGSGMWRSVVFDGILTLTHHATNNNLPGAANITTAAGDRAVYYSDGTTVYCAQYQRAASAPLPSLGTGVAAALSVNVGSAGAVVVFDGAGGTPSSMTGTNITGTATGLTAGDSTKWGAAAKTVSTAAPSGGANGDIWIQY